MNNCKPLKVVGRGSKTQLQVGENLNYEILIIQMSALRVNVFLRGIISRIVKSRPLPCCRYRIDRYLFKHFAF